MKRLCKILLIIAVMLICTLSISFAVEEYTHTRNYVFYNSGKTTSSDAQIKIFIGQKDVTSYGKDGDIVIKPTPNKTTTDEFGNMYAYFDVSGYKPGRSITITITRSYVPSDFEEDIPVRTESTVSLSNEMYVKPQKNIECDDSEIIATAKELAYGLSSDYKRAKRIFEYVNTTMSYDSSAGVSNKGALAALKNKKGQCYDYSTLYAALCRAIDIPCKVVVGYKVDKKVSKESEQLRDLETGEFYNTPEEYVYEFVPHAWNEVWFDDFGWVPVDTCVVYNVNGKKAAYWDSFCKIKGSEYYATGILNAIEDAEWEYSGIGTFALKSSVETYLPYEVEEAKQHKFEDIGNYTWAEDSINTLYSMGVIKGYTDTEFGPAANITRIDFICMLARILKNMNYQPAIYKKVYYYMDYDQTHYSKQEYDFLMRCLEDAYPYSSFSAGYGAMGNIFEGKLEPTKAITRGEVVALMDAFLKKKADGSANFSDMYGSKFADSISKSYTNGLIQGYEDGTFRPNNPITRAEIAVILDRYVGVKDFTM